MRTLVGTQRLVERAARLSSVPESAVLRFGYLYGPGTWWSPDGACTIAVLAAVTSDATGVYNVAGPECPATRDWLPALAHALRVRPPRRVPTWAARAAGAGAAAHLCDSAPRVSTHKARDELGWAAARTWDATASFANG